MSEVEQTPAPVAEQRTEDSKPTELPAEQDPLKAADTTEPVSTEPKAVEETKPVELPQSTEPEKTGEPATTTIPEETKAAESKPTEPITSGVLGYKAPGLLNQLKFSKRHFWLGDEPISTQNLSTYLRGEKPEVAHPNAAWSSKTGKGLLYITKTEGEKSHPHDILNLSDATHLERLTPHEFSFKIHGKTHIFKANSDAERDSWYTSIEKTISEANDSKEGILNHDDYKNTISHLGKPAALAGGVAGGSAVPKAIDSKEEKKEEKAEEKAEAAEAKEAKRATSDDETPKKKTEGRSISRGKRSSIFGAFKQKKEEHDVKKEQKKEEKEEIKEESAEEKAVTKEPSPDNHVAEGAALGTAAAVPAAAEVKKDQPTEESKPIETADAVAPSKEAPKPTKRNSIFGSFYQKVRSPTTEKRESEAAPQVPPKDEPISDEAPRLPEPATETPVETPTITEQPVESKPEEAVTPAAAPIATDKESPKIDTPKVETPKTERKGSFFGNLVNKARAKSPANGKREAPVASSEEAPAVPPKDESVPAVTESETKPEADTAVPALPTSTEAEKPEEAKSEVPKTTTPKLEKEPRRKSYFGSIGGNKKEKTEGENGEKPLSKIGSIFRRPSQAVRGANNKDSKKENVAPEKLEETPTETKEPETINAPAPSEEKPNEAEKPTEIEKPEQSIGDVVPSAVNVDQPGQSNPTVSAAA